MAIRDWSDGELLTAAAMTELTGSMNMRFPNAAARDATLTGGLSPVPGMTVFMLDSNIALTYTAAGYWAPPAESLCFFGNQAATQSLALNTFTAITGFTLTNHGNRNLNGWFDPVTGRFTPKVPGIYEFFGGLSMTSGPVGLTYSHRGGFRANGTGNTTYIAATEYRHTITTNVSASFNLRRFWYAMNGTTDYMEIVAWAANATNTGTGAQAPTFGAKYVGP